MATTKNAKVVWLHDGLGVEGVQARTAKALYRAADHGGTIQAGDMQRILPGADPRSHAACSLVGALRAAGATRILDGNGDEVL